MKKRDHLEEQQQKTFFLGVVLVPEQGKTHGLQHLSDFPCIPQQQQQEERSESAVRAHPLTLRQRERGGEGERERKLDAHTQR